MWMIDFLFYFSTLLIAWMMFGYFLLLWIQGLFRRNDPPQKPEVYPFLTLIIPCFNEERDVLQKLENTRLLKYPREKFEVIFADGGSTDKTLEILERELKPDEPIRVVQCPHGGKINQVNHVLPSAKGEIICNSDVDTIVSEDALEIMAGEFVHSPDVWAIGAFCTPKDAFVFEEYHWSAQNKGRLMETDAGTSSIVVAPCYAFRRDLFKQFPEDVIADDIFVAYLTNTIGKRTVYSRYAKAVETRVPRDYRGFLPHKFRKSNAFLRETLRFIYRLPEMTAFCKIMFLTRLGQQILLPFAIFFWISLALALLMVGSVLPVFGSLFFLIVTFALTSQVFYHTDLPEGSAQFPLKIMVKGYFITLLIMLATGISYPFYSQTSSYARLDSK